mmetsp:Transcript_57743/g.154272  ORF Transcript_57743/g.154272 Transcript_57743/m.154272 type:complete len:906 (+) Transcript_57743:1-2718(+)
MIREKPVAGTASTGCFALSRSVSPGRFTAWQSGAGTSVARRVARDYARTRAPTVRDRDGKLSFTRPVPGHNSVARLKERLEKLSDESQTSTQTPSSGVGTPALQRVRDAAEKRRVDAHVGSVEPHASSWASSLRAQRGGKVDRQWKPSGSPSRRVPEGLRASASPSRNGSPSRREGPGLRRPPEYFNRAGHYGEIPQSGDVTARMENLARSLVDLWAETPALPVFHPPQRYHPHLHGRGAHVTRSTSPTSAVWAQGEGCRDVSRSPVRSQHQSNPGSSMPAEDPRYSSPPPRTRLFLTSPTGDLYLRPTAHQRNVPSSGCRSLDEVIERALRGIAETSEEVMRKKAAQVQAGAPPRDRTPSCGSSTPRLDSRPEASVPSTLSPTVEEAWQCACRVFASIPAGAGGVVSRSDLVRALRGDATVLAFGELLARSSDDAGSPDRAERFFQSLESGGGHISLQELERCFLSTQASTASVTDHWPLEIAALKSPASARAEDDRQAPLGISVVSEWEEDSGRRRESVESRASSALDESMGLGKSESSNFPTGAGVDLQLLPDTDLGEDLASHGPGGHDRPLPVSPADDEKSGADDAGVESTGAGDQPRGSTQHAFRRQRSFPAYLEERSPVLQPQDAPVAAEWQEDSEPTSQTVQFADTDRGPGTRRRGTMFPSRLLSDSESEDDMAAAVAFSGGQDTSDDEADGTVTSNSATAGPARDLPSGSGTWAPPQDETPASAAAPPAPDSPPRGVRWADDDQQTVPSTSADTGPRVKWQPGGGRRGTAMPGVGQVPAEDSGDEAGAAAAPVKPAARPARRGTAMPPAHTRQADVDDPSEDSGSNSGSADEESSEAPERQPRRASSFPSYVDAPEQQQVLDDQSEASDRSLSAEEVRTVLKRTSMMVSAPALDDGE